MVIQELRSAMTDEAFQALHDRLTRGMPLSAEERASLDTWYTQQDQEERAALGGAPVSERIRTLRTQVQSANGELITVTQRIQTLTAENERLRAEITKLQGQVSRRSKAQPT
jgi:hypothetical protein